MEKFLRKFFILILKMLNSIIKLEAEGCLRWKFDFFKSFALFEACRIAYHDFSDQMDCQESYWNVSLHNSLLYLDMLPIMLDH